MGCLARRGVPTARCAGPPASAYSALDWSEWHGPSAFGSTAIMSEATLYDEDIILWSERQAALLRRRAAGELVNDTDLDWANIAEEIESVGNEQRHAVESLLIQTMLHLLKRQAWPEARDSGHWRDEARVFRAQAANRFVPSMRQRIDVARLWRLALRAMPRLIDGQPPLAVPDTCPPTLDELLDGEE